jgi:hypothetical protein
MCCAQGCQLMAASNTLQLEDNKVFINFMWPTIGNFYIRLYGIKSDKDLKYMKVNTTEI